MDRVNKNMRGSVGDNRSSPSTIRTDANHVRALLVGLVFQLGLFLIHSRNSHRARATSILFDQLLRHMKLLETMAGHDRNIVLQRVGRSLSPRDFPPNYHITLGDVTINGLGSTIASGKSGAGSKVPMDSALGQAFNCFSAHGIDSLSLALPCDSDHRIDQLCLALNIIARFRDAVENSASIVFRYGGRSIRVPVVCDNFGRPDPNLTSMAGLNGISAANAGELVKQADACRALAAAEGKLAEKEGVTLYSSYKLIFSFTSLSSQLIKPRIEINLLPWRVDDSVDGDIPDASLVLSRQATMPNDDDFEGRPVDPRFAWRSFSVDRFREPITYQCLVDLLKTDGSKSIEAICAVTADNFDRMDIQGVGHTLLAASTLIKAIKRHSRDPLIVERLIYHLQGQLVLVPEAVLANIDVQRKGIKFHGSSGTLVVGMIHPKLLDMIALVKSAAVTRQKLRAAENISFAFNYPNVRMVLERFGIDATYALHLLRLLKSTISSSGRFNRDAFEGQLDDMRRYGDTLFEIYYCLLTQMPHRMDRLVLLDVFSSIVERLKHPAVVLRFLLDTIFHPDHQIEYPDRNAFVMANSLLLERSSFDSERMDHTPDIWLSMDCRTNPDVWKYANWRLSVDRVCMGITLEKMQMAIFHRLAAQPEQQSMPASFLMALEREAFILLSLTGTSTARTIFRRALLRYSDPQSSVYQGTFKTSSVGAIIDHLQTIIFGLGRTGNLKDCSSLDAFADNIERLAAIDDGTDYSQKIERVLRCKEAALQAIRSRKKAL